MKNVYISIIIFVILISVMFFSVNYLSKTTKSIKEINNNIEHYVAKDDWDNAYKLSMKFTQSWDKHSKIVKIFVNHQELDNVEMELWKLPQYIKEQSKDEALASIHVLKFFLDHITNLEKINFQNIF